MPSRMVASGLSRFRKLVQRPSGGSRSTRLVERSLVQLAGVRPWRNTLLRSRSRASREPTRTMSTSSSDTSGTESRNSPIFRLTTSAALSRGSGRCSTPCADTAMQGENSGFLRRSIPARPNWRRLTSSKPLEPIFAFRTTREARGYMQRPGCYTASQVSQWFRAGDACHG